MTPTTALLAALAAIAADVATTRRGLSLGAREVNPILGRGSTSRVLAINAALFLALWLLVRLEAPAVQTTAWLVVAAGHLLASAWNLYQLRRARCTPSKQG